MTDGSNSPAGAEQPKTLEQRVAALEATVGTLESKLAIADAQWSARVGNLEVTLNASPGARQPGGFGNGFVGRTKL